MKRHIENWRKFLLREQKEKFVIFEDMDGVLCDFITPILKRINNTLNNLNKIQDKELLSLSQQVKEKVGNREVILKDIKENGPKIIHELLFKVIEDDIEFWANLEWLPGGKQLWKYVSQFEHYILSAPARGAGKDNSIQGKKIWIQKNLNIPLDKCFFTSEKYKYAKPNAVLIDDYEKNIKEWESHGGIGILHTDTKSTIEKLNNLLVLSHKS